MQANSEEIAVRRIYGPEPKKEKKTLIVTDKLSFDNISSVACTVKTRQVDYHEADKLFRHYATEHSIIASFADKDKETFFIENTDYNIKPYTDNISVMKGDVIVLVTLSHVHPTKYRIVKILDC